MFGRRVKQKKLCVEGYDVSNNIIYRSDIVDVVLPERILLELSMEYFNDPEPCEIHRAAVQKRVMMELVQLCGVNKQTAVENLSEDHRACFPKEVNFVGIREES